MPSTRPTFVFRENLHLQSRRLSTDQTDLVSTGFCQPKFSRKTTKITVEVINFHSDTHSIPES